MASAYADEVAQMATNYGIERIVGTQEFNGITKRISDFEKSSTKLSGLEKESKWIDTKRAIEAEMRSISLDSNNSGELWLLGNANSAVSFADVRTSFLEAWEQVLTLHSKTLANMEEMDLKEIDMWRNSQLDSIPEYGSLQEKSTLIESLKVKIQQLSSELAEQSNAESKAAKIEGVGQRETTRRIMLAQAEMDIKSNIITESEYQKIIKLIGLQGSLFQQQLAALSSYGDNYASLFKQLDQTLAAARDEIKKTEGRESLAGGYFGATPRSENINEIKRATSHLGTSIGDGIRSHFPRPDTVGVGVPVRRGDGTYFPGGIFQPWIGIPNHMEQNNTFPGVDPDTIDPRAASREGFTTGNPAEPSSRPGSPYKRGVGDLFGTKNRGVQSGLSGSRLDGVSQNGQLGNAGWSPNGMSGFTTSDIPGVDSKEHPIIASMFGLGLFAIILNQIAPITKALGARYKDKVEGDAAKISSKRDNNPEVEVELGNDEEAEF